MQQKGRIVEWKDERGFGFVEPLSGKGRAFVHISAFINPSRRPVVGELVSYRLKRDGKGRTKADKVRIIGRQMNLTDGAKVGSYSLVLVFVFGLFLFASVVLGYLHEAVLALYALASTITFLAYAVDKSSAKSLSWRTPEPALHMLALIGGWPGALIAQQWFRHKSSKKSFQQAFKATVVVNCLILAWLFTDSGQQLLDVLVHLFPYFSTVRYK